MISNTALFYGGKITDDTRPVVGSGSLRRPSGSVDSMSNTLRMELKVNSKDSFAKSSPGQILYNERHFGFSDGEDESH